MQIVLPWPDAGLSPNARLHHMAKARLAAAYKKQCAWEAKARIGRAVFTAPLSLKIEFCPPDLRRRDRDNMIAAFKAGADGLALAVKVDDAKWIPTYVFGDPVKGGKVVVTL